jgi:hypothetical protein
LEWWHPIYEMENKKYSKPPIRVRCFSHENPIFRTREFCWRSRSPKRTPFCWPFKHHIRA